MKLKFQSKNLLFACGPLGCVDPIKPGLSGGAGISWLISALLALVIGFAGIFAIFQFIFAGYGYLNSSGDPKKAEAAWNKITYAVLGLVIIGGSFLFAEIIGRVTGQNPLRGINILGP